MGTDMSDRRAAVIFADTLTLLFEGNSFPAWQISQLVGRLEVILAEDEQVVG